MKLPRQILGVPLHPLLVHFPITFWLSVPVFDTLALVDGPELWWRLALVSTLIGVIMGMFAIITGFMEYLHRSAIDVSVRLAASHGVRTAIAWLIFTAKLIFILLASNSPIVIGICLMLDLFASGILVQGVFFGTRLAYRGTG